MLDRNKEPLTKETDAMKAYLGFDNLDKLWQP